MVVIQGSWTKLEQKVIYPINVMHNNCRRCITTINLYDARNELQWLKLTHDSTRYYRDSLNYYRPNTKFCRLKITINLSAKLSSPLWRPLIPVRMKGRITPWPSHGHACVRMRGTCPLLYLDSIPVRRASSCCSPFILSTSAHDTLQSPHVS